MTTVSIPIGAGYYKILTIPISGGNYPSDAMYKCDTFIKAFIYKDNPMSIEFIISVYGENNLKIERVDFSNEEVPDDFISWKKSSDEKFFNIYINPNSYTVAIHIYTPISRNGTGSIINYPLTHTEISKSDLTLYNYEHLINVDNNSILKNTQEYAMDVRGSNVQIAAPPTNRYIIDAAYVGQDQEFKQCTICKNAQGSFMRFQYEQEDLHLSASVDSDYVTFNISSYGLLYIKCSYINI